MAETLVIDSELIAGFEPERSGEGHKNNFGTALICAGSGYMTGAAVLAASSALRSGVGLVRVFSEEKVLDAVRFIEPCALLELRPDDTARLIRKAGELSRISDSVLIGPGIPSDYMNMEALTETFLNGPVNVVLDAGVFSGKPDVMARLKEQLRKRNVPAVLTPHIGEFARITGVDKAEVTENADDLVLEFSRDNNCVTVLKSSRTLVATPDGKLYVYDLANSGLAKGGSGDVLAGLITGFLAQGMEPYKASCSAVYIQSMAGKAAADDLGVRYMLPTDLLNYLPEGYSQAGWSDNDD